MSTPATNQGDGTGTAERIGGWLFQQRSWLPLPIIFVLLFVNWTRTDRGWVLYGLAPLLVVLGEGLRLWGVRQIGVISRTRSDRLGPLIAEGPFRLTRNPLYLGNIALWCGLAAAAGLVWLIPLILLVLGAEYHAIVRWEERLLRQRLGAAYAAYAARVPRWWPNIRDLGTALRDTAAFPWRSTFYSERGTLIALAAGFALLAVKRRLS